MANNIKGNSFFDYLEKMYKNEFTKNDVENFMDEFAVAYIITQHDQDYDYYNCSIMDELKKCLKRVPLAKSTLLEYFNCKEDEFGIGRFHFSEEQGEKCEYKVILGDVSGLKEYFENLEYVAGYASLDIDTIEKLKKISGEIELNEYEFENADLSKFENSKLYINVPDSDKYYWIKGWPSGFSIKKYLEFKKQQEKSNELDKNQSSVLDNLEENENSHKGQVEEKNVETKTSFEQVVSQMDTLKLKREELSRQIEEKRQEIASASVGDLDAKKQELKNLVVQEKFNEISMILEQIKAIENEKSRNDNLNRELQELEEKLGELGISTEDLEKNNEIDEM